MSRSRKHTPITGNVGAWDRSEKKDKRKANRRLRARQRSAVKKGVEVLPALREVSNVYSFMKDGKHYVSGGWRRKAMRK